MKNHVKIIIISIAFLLLTSTGAAAAFVTISGFDPENETVTVMNTALIPADLGGWRISDNGGAGAFVFPPFTLAGQVSVRVHTGPGANTATDLYWGLAAGEDAWNDAGDVVTLYDPSGTRIADSEGYQAPPDTSTLPRYVEGDIIRFRLGGVVSTSLVVNVIPNDGDPIYKTYAVVRVNGTWTIPRFVHGLDEIDAINAARFGTTLVEHVSFSDVLITDTIPDEGDFKYGGFTYAEIRQGRHHVALWRDVRIVAVNVRDEYVVLRNFDVDPATLGGEWSLTDEGARHVYTFPEGTVLRPGAEITVVSDASGSDTPTTLYWTDQPVWSNRASTAYLYVLDELASSLSATPAAVTPTPTPPTPITTVTTPVPIATTPGGPPVVTTPTVVTPAPQAPFGVGKRYAIGSPGSFIGTRFGSGGTPAGGGAGAVTTPEPVLRPGSRAYGLKPPAGRFIRWYPAARWMAGIR